jgi:PhnB protein
MQANPYLSFDGQCEAAFKFYEQYLGAKPGAIFHYAGTPFADQAPADWGNKVMHGNLTIGDLELMAADVTPDRYEPPKGFSLSLHIETVADAERIFGALSEGGRVVMALEKTFWADRFGMVVDRFGIPWLINCGGSDQPSEA